MGIDYSNINLDSGLRSRRSLPARRKAKVQSGEYVDPISYEPRFEIQGKSAKITTGAFSEEFVGYDKATDTVSNFESGSSLSFTASIRFNVPHRTKKMFGNPYFALYEGSVDTTAGTPLANFQIYPIIGGSVTVGRYQVQAYPYNAHVYGGVPTQMAVMVVDTNGTSTQQITYRIDAKYFNYPSGAT